LKPSEEEIVAEIESVRRLLRENRPKAKEADYRLGLLARRIAEGR